MTMKTFEKALLVIDIQENLVNPDLRMHIDVTNINQFFKNVNRTIELFEKSGFPVPCWLNSVWFKIKKGIIEITPVTKKLLMCNLNH